MATLTKERAMNDVDAIFPLLWKINDMLRLTDDGSVVFDGSQNDVLDLREALHRLDPDFSRGLPEQDT
jgi:hypothetical protein